jgi:hypothetical protein
MKKVYSDHSLKVREGLARAAAQGRHAGRPRKVTDDAIRNSIPLGTSAGAKEVGLSISSYIRRRRLIEDGANG